MYTFPRILIGNFSFALAALLVWTKESSCRLLEFQQEVGFGRDLSRQFASTSEMPLDSFFANISSITLRLLP
jgi:hypothetical protein